MLGSGAVPAGTACHRSQFVVVAHPFDIFPVPIAPAQFRAAGTRHTAAPQSASAPREYRGVLCTQASSADSKFLNTSRFKRSEGADDRLL